VGVFVSGGLDFRFFLLLESQHKGEGGSLAPD
jgi:hypothetical protein